MNDDGTVKVIRKYADKRGLKVYSIAYYHKWCDKNIELDPLDVFKWFACADIVFTDTFHGSVISLATGAQFISKIRGNGNKLAFLLEQYGVSDRKVDNFGGIEVISKSPIDYSIVRLKITDNRKKSFDFLKNSIS